MGVRARVLAAAVLAAGAGLGFFIHVAATAAVLQVDDAPLVVAVYPPPGATGVAPEASRDGSLAVSFSEPVTITAAALELDCERSGRHALMAGGGPAAFSFVSDRALLPGELCVGSVLPEEVRDADGDDPPDHPPHLYTWSFRAAGAPVMINELDAISPGGVGDFVELYDGGRGATDLGGLTVVFYRGDEASVYLAVGLDGFATDGAGYLVLGASGVAGAGLALANDALRDGPDAVALYAAPESEFPRNAPVRTADLLDAAVYGPADERLLALLAAGQAPLDEAGRGAAGADSSQRCPNGGGRPRETAAFIQNGPTPGQPNACLLDDAPVVAAVWPSPGATEVAPDATIEVTFSEPMALDDAPLELDCEGSGRHAYGMSGGPVVFAFAPVEPLARGEQCVATVWGERARDADEQDPPDRMGADFAWSFRTAAPPAGGILINEIDTDTPGVDSGEFVELYDGGAGGTSLDGLALVLFNGADDRSYLTLGLDGYATDGAGYFVLGNAALAGIDATLPDGALQNGPDGVALVAGDAAGFPNGTPAGAVSPLDAVVYARPGQEDAGLQPLLNAGQPQVNENGGGDADAHSSQRCPDGAGGARNTNTYRQNLPTPGTENYCPADDAPEVIDFSPGRGASGVALEVALTIEFSEPVSVGSKWITWACDQSGKHTYRTQGGPTLFTVEPNAPMAHSESCTITVVPTLVSDLDADDPPDQLERKKSWSFTTVQPPADFILINEIDPDTPGVDAAEFIELYDGGVGRTTLDGLALVLFNGSTNLSYRAIDLDGMKTDAAGYFVVGNSAVDPGLEMTNGALQNGPDAVALYVADAAQFPFDSPIGQQGLIDAVVYGDPTTVSPELLALLAAGQESIEEDSRGAADQHALQRCPDGAGGPRRTDGYLPSPPTPAAANSCVTDDPPAWVDRQPEDGAVGVSIYASLSLSFSEPVALASGAVSLSCAAGGVRALSISGGPTTYNFAPTQPLPAGDTCQVRVTAALVSDSDGDDPPDHPVSDAVWSFITGAPPPNFVLINEIDADTPGSDTAEFIELYDGGLGNTDLTGLALVMYNGHDDRAYYAVDLDGMRTNGAGYVVIGNDGVAGRAADLPTGMLQNGADAVALYAGDATAFPNGAVLNANGLLDAIVYGTNDATDVGLLALLLAGETQVDEAGRGAADLHSSGRCPDGAGGQRRTAAFRQGLPSPGAANHCLLDDPPEVTEVDPADGATGVAPNTTLAITFSEEVVIGPGWYAIECESSGAHAAVVSGGPTQFTLTPETLFDPGETCAVTLSAPAITDADADDPPDHPAANFAWSFTTAAVPPADFVIINELDADTPGSDTQEFIELYDGGAGDTDLSGLVLVFWNGSDDAAYRAIGLDGQRTDAAGYFVLGNGDAPDVDLVFAKGALQNGPDAVGLYAGRAADFPAGTPIKVDGLIDAMVYGPADETDSGLLPLLLSGEMQVGEDERGNADEHSLQRCPNGEGGPRRTSAYRPNAPTAGNANVCTADEPPAVVAVEPPPGATGVSFDTEIEITFSEDVAVGGNWYAIQCAASGPHPAAVTGGPRTYALNPATPFLPNEACNLTLFATGISDTDADDPPDRPEADFKTSFTTTQAPVDFVLINEIDADTPGVDAAEFIELYDGGVGLTDLSGLALVFWNGQGDTAYRAIDLDGQRTDAAGYFVVGNEGVPGIDLVMGKGALQNGPDAVTLVAGDASEFPSGTALTTANLIDAIVYGPADSPDDGLLVLLEPNQPQVDEDARGEKDIHSLQRCPNGGGGPRRTDMLRANLPTPGSLNDCRTDDPPVVVAVSPVDGAAGVSAHAVVTVRFSEDVVVDDEWYLIECDRSGPHPSVVEGGLREFTLRPDTPFAPGESCTVTLWADKAHDTDADDPPDSPAADTVWRFHVAQTAGDILINELDSDTPGRDTAEFIELYDGGRGGTVLDGFVIVLWNGKDERAYRAIDLSGYQTGPEGYFVLGSVPGAGLELAEGTLQNGPDAVGLHVGRAADFPGGTQLTTAGLIDAVVYGPDADDTAGLLPLLAVGQFAVDEGGAGAREAHSLQRCPDGGGGPRHSDHIRPTEPTAGAANHCGPGDDAPGVISLAPADGETGVAPDAVIRVAFSEDVTVGEAWYEIACETSGTHAATVEGGPRVFTLVPLVPFAPGEACEARLVAAAIRDADTDDPPDHPAADVVWRFHIATVPLLAGFVANGPLWIGQTAVFTNTSSGPGPLVYAWDFGDGSPPSTETHPTHVYASPGLYTVTLRVVGPVGTAIHAAEVAVRPRSVYLGWVAR